ncbi:MAG: HalX domain-containing protein [Halodesulfurarchaeum sp.]
MTEEMPTVLIVDDEVNITELFSAWLEGSYDVRTAVSGEEALDELDDDVDVVLLDRRMPGLSGDEVLEVIREETQDCRVAMVTAVEPDFDVIEMGFDDYLTKPIDREDLEEIIETLLERKEYDDRMQEYFSLASKKATLEAAKPTSELEASEEYQRLVEEVEALEAELDTALETTEDFETAFKDL